MWTIKAETLSKLKFFMNHPRANGKTWLMINGIANSESEAVVIVVNQDHARWIKNEARNPKLKFVSLDNIEKLYGNLLPIAFDHFTVTEIIQYAFDALRGLQEENAILKSEVHALKEYKDEKSGQNSKDKAAGREIRNTSGRRTVRR
jgi:hypothetical protein